jgi:hypothetical protein
MALAIAALVARAFGKFRWQLCNLETSVTDGQANRALFGA